MNNNFKGAKLTIHTINGDNFSLPVNALELAVMLKAIGFYKQGNEVTSFGEKTLKQILDRQINPFTLSDILGRQDIPKLE